MHSSLSKLLFVLALAIKLNLPTTNNSGKNNGLIFAKATPLDLGNSIQSIVATISDTGNKALPALKSVIPLESTKSKQTASARNTPSKSGQIDWKYPIVRRDQSVVETIHGYKIADPYRWLEDTKSNETKAFSRTRTN
ncbi:hypothetical protein BDF19DRAFT_245035 [Syncephalis fuscata]|nr:hypothetical protein BDF19DRAFT_245035 [Syncephalis fuscata]